MQRDVPLITQIGSWVGVFLASVLAVLTGILLGGAELMLAQVPVLDSPDGSAQVTFVRGPMTKGEWFEKFRALTNGQLHEVTFSQGELNRLGFEMFRHRQSVLADYVQMQPNVRIHNSQIQFGLIINSNTLSYPIIFQARGHFVFEHGRFEFACARAHIGQLPIKPKVGANLVNGFFAQAFSSADAKVLRQAWAGLEQISLKGDSIELKWF